MKKPPTEDVMIGVKFSKVIFHDSFNSEYGKMKPTMMAVEIDSKSSLSALILIKRNYKGR